MRMAMWLRGRDARQLKQQHSRVRILIEHLMMRFICRIYAFSCLGANRQNSHRDREQPQNNNESASHSLILVQFYCQGTLP
jgi:hypothetical protein